jgi:hypothetical protein
VLRLNDDLAMSMGASGARLHVRAVARASRVALALERADIAECLLMLSQGVLTEQARPYTGKHRLWRGS